MRLFPPHLNVERWTLNVERSLLLAFALVLAAVPPVHARTEQWGVGNRGFSHIGGRDLLSWDGFSFWSYVADIQNYGTCSADNMVSEKLAAMNGVPLDILYFYDGNGTDIPWTVNADASVAFNYFVAAGYQYELNIVFQPGCNPGRLRLSAMAGNLGGDPIPFNDLIIGPPYAQPSLTLAPAAPPGPGTNAVSIAVASDAETLMIQYRDTLAATNWTNLRLCAVTGAVTVATDTNSAPTRFYRAVVPVP